MDELKEARYLGLAFLGRHRLTVLDTPHETDAPDTLGGLSA